MVLLESCLQINGHFLETVHLTAAGSSKAKSPCGTNVSPVSVQLIGDRLDVVSKRFPFQTLPFKILVTNHSKNKLDGFCLFFTCWGLKPRTGMELRCSGGVGSDYCEMDLYRSTSHAFLTTVLMSGTLSFKSGDLTLRLIPTA